MTADKWQLLNDLTLGADAFGLGHRTLGVLKALLSFLPGRELAPEGLTVVFPSNQTLSQRLNGMPESTLRRHLATLVKSGLVRRQDSPNRKRYARFAEGQGIAFGFDLAPLAAAADALRQAAERALKARQARQMLHAEITALCHRLGSSEITDRVRKALRRKDNLEELRGYLSELRDMCPDELSGSHSQNERQLQKTEKMDSVEEAPPELSAVRSACPAAESLCPGAFRNWAEAQATARNLAPMMGIETHVIRQAENTLGEKTATVTILAMLERVSTLRNPGGYLRRLVQLGESGAFTAKSALGLANCQLTIPKRL